MSESEMPAGQVILLVEDNPRDEALTLRSLRKHNIGNPVVVARDGVEALEYLFGTGKFTGRDTADLPQVVLMDLKMPKLDGLQVLERVRADERTARVPVVMFTSSDEEDDIIRSYDLGVNSYVRKPVGFAEFSEATRRLGLYWVLTNEPPPYRAHPQP